LGTRVIDERACQIESGDQAALGEDGDFEQSRQRQQREVSRDRHTDRVE